MDDWFLRAPHGHISEATTFFPVFQCLPRSVTTHPISTPRHPFLRRSPRSRSHHLGSSFQLFLTVVWLTFHRRNMEKTRTGVEGKIKKRRKLAVSKGTLRKVTETRRTPPRGSPEVAGANLRESPLIVSPPDEISAKFTVETRPINFIP